MSSLVGDLMFRGFIRKRYPLTNRYPLFYAITARRAALDTHMAPLQWSESDIVFADACYTLWVYTMFLGYITIHSRVEDFLVENVRHDQWYNLRTFESYAVSVTSEAILGWDQLDDDESVPLHPTPPVRDSIIFDVPLIKSTFDWKLSLADPDTSLRSDADVVSFDENTQTTRFTAAKIVDTVKEVKTILDGSIGRRFETGLFLQYVHDIVNNLVGNNPNGQIREALIKGLEPRHCESCRGDVLPAVFLHVCTMHAVLGNPVANIREVELVTRQGVDLYEYEKQYLGPVVKRELERGPVVFDVNRDEGESSGRVDETITIANLDVNVQFLDIPPEDGSRDGLSEPHIYAYVSHKRGLALQGGPIRRKTKLESMYDGTEGCMRLLDHEGNATITLMYNRTNAACYLCIMIFYKNKREGNYTAVSRGYVKLDKVGSITQNTALTTFAGPMTSQFSVEQDDTTGTMGKIKKNFEYIPEAIVRFGGVAGAGPTKALPNLLLNGEDEQKINEFTENFYRMATRAGLKKPQNFVFKGVPGAVIPINVGVLLEPRTVKTWMINASYRRMLNRFNMTDVEFVMFIARTVEHRTAWDVMRLKHAIIETFNLVNVLNYTNDVVLHKDVDVHQDVRLTNNGDCEDFAWALFSIIKGVLRAKLTGAGSDVHFDGLDRGAEGMIWLLRKQGAEPLFISMYIDYRESNLHSAVMIRTSEDSFLGNILMEGTGTHHGDFCSSTQFTHEQQQSVAWYTSLSEKVKERNHLVGEHMFSVYAGPKNSTTDEFDQASDEKFYVGFLGAVNENGEYVRFIEKGGDIRHLQETGVDLCDVINRHKFELVRVEGQEHVDPAVAAELQNIAALAPPLPNYYADKEESQEYSSTFLSHASIFAAALKHHGEGGVVRGVNKKALMNSVSAFYNLQGKTTNDVMTAADALNSAIIAFKMATPENRISEVDVRIYSIFRGATTIEIVMHRGVKHDE